MSFVSRLFFLFLVASVCSFVAPVTGNEILAERTSTFVSGDAVFQNKTIQYRCDAEDAGVTFTYTIVQEATGNETDVNITCGALKYIYRETLIGYVPEDGTLHTSEFCGTRNVLSPFTNTNISLTRYAGFDNLFSLASFRENDGPEWSLQNEMSPIARKPLFFGAVSAGLVGGAIGGFVGCSMGFCGGGSSNVQGQLDNLALELQDYRATSDELLSQNARLLALSTRRDQLILASLDGINQDIDMIVDTTQQLANADQLQLEAINRQYNFTLQVYDAVNAIVDKVGSDLTNTISLMNTQDTYLATNIGALATELQELFTYQSHVNGNMSTHLNELNADYGAFKQNVQGRLEKTSRVLRNLIGRIKSVFEQRQINRLLNRQIFLNKDSAETGGLFPFLSSTEPGTEPSDLESLKYAIVMSDVMVVYADEDGLSNVRGYQIQIQYKCDLQFILEMETIANDVFDLLSLMGPSNCTEPDEDAVFESSNSTCNCWVTWEKKSCILTAPGATTAESTTFTDQFQINETAVCSGALSTEESLTFTQALEFTAKLDEICQGGTHSSNTGQFHIVSNVLNVDILVDPLSASAAECDISTDPAYIGSALNANPHLANTIGKYMEYAFSFSINHRLDPYMQLLDGVAPSYLTYEKTWRIINNYRAECHRAHFMAFSDTFLPVYVIEPIEITQDITVSVEGEASYVVDDVTPVTSFAFVLPSDYVVVGQVDGSVVYDIPSNDLRTGPLPTLRENSITYNAVPALNASHAATLFTMDQWRSRYTGFEFNHLKATNVPAIYEKSVDGVTGVCLNESFAGDSWCSKLEFFTVDRVTSSSFALSPRTGSASFATITIPDGTVIGRLLNTQCPSWTNVRASARSINIVLGNEGTTTLETAIVRTGDCTDSDTVFIPPRSQHIYYVPECVLGETFVSLFRYDESRNLVACENATSINATVDRPAYLETFEGSADDRLVRFITTNATDRAFLGVTSTTLILQQELASTLKVMATVIQSLSIPILDSVSLEFNNTLDVILANTQTINETIAEWQQDDAQLEDIGDIRASFVTDMNSLISQTETVLNSTRASIDELLASRFAAETLQDLLNQTTIAYSETLASINELQARQANLSIEILEALVNNDQLLAEAFNSPAFGDWFENIFFAGPRFVAKLAGAAAKGLVGLGKGAFKGLFYFVVVMAGVGLVVLVVWGISKFNGSGGFKMVGNSGYSQPTDPRMLQDMEELAKKLEDMQKKIDHVYSIIGNSRV